MELSRRLRRTGCVEPVAGPQASDRLEKNDPLNAKTGSNMTTPTPTNLIAVVRRQLGKNLARLTCAAGAEFLLVGAGAASALTTSLNYLVVPSSGNLPGAGNDGPGIYTLPGYGNVEITMTGATPPLGASYFDQINAYNQTTNNAAENLAHGSFNWGTDTQRFGILNTNTVNDKYQFNFTFLSGVPNPADLYFNVVGLAVGTTATVSQAGTLMGEYQFPPSGFYPGGPSSTTLYNVAGPQTFSSMGDGDQLNTGWALWQPSSAILNTAGTGFGTLSFAVNQIPGDGIGFTVGYTAVPEPASMGLLGIGSLALLSRRRRNLRPPKNEESIHSMRFGVGAASVIAAGFLCVAIPPARATSVYSQDFNSGSATFTVNDPFWIDNNRANGFITQTTNTNAIWPGAPGQFSTDITSDVSGNGYFLFDGTYLYNGTTSPTIPVGSDEFFISPTFSVATNTNYTVSFYLTDANGISPPSVQPQINGALLGSPVSPVGTFGSNGWQQFSFSWNSGANTSRFFDPFMTSTRRQLETISAWTTSMLARALCRNPLRWRCLASGRSLHYHAAAEKLPPSSFRLSAWR